MPSSVTISAMSYADRRTMPTGLKISSAGAAECATSDRPSRPPIRSVERACQVTDVPLVRASTGRVSRRVRRPPEVVRQMRTTSPSMAGQLAKGMLRQPRNPSSATRNHNLVGEMWVWVVIY